MSAFDPATLHVWLDALIELAVWLWNGGGGVGLAMITLITGLPGNGKTLYALQYVAAAAKKEGRAVFYHGIKGLDPALGWHELPTSKEVMNGRDVLVPQWWLCPAQSICLIDEAQMCGFGVRPRGQVPEWAQKLEVHRHLGIDLVMITQDPKLIDSHDRSLMELHFHLLRTFGMQRSTVHEFRPVRDNIKSRTGSIQHKWKFPKEVFKWYTSAEAHTHKARIPMKVWVLGFMCIALPAFCYYLYTRLDPRLAKGAPTAQPTASAPAFGGGGGSSRGGSKMTTQEFLVDQTPRVAGLAYTAPVYDDVTKPVEAPYPAACVSMGERCRCYSQQATKLETPRDLCLSIVAGGFYVAWQAKAAPPTGAPESAARRDGGGPLPTAAPAVTLDASSGARMVPTAAMAPQETGQEGPGRGRLLPRVQKPS